LASNYKARPLTHQLSLAASAEGESRIGLRGRLLLAFVGISMFAAVAGLTGQYAFNEVGKALDRSGSTIPPALDALELTRETEQILTVVPRMLTVQTTQEVERRYAAAS